MKNKMLPWIILIIIVIAFVIFAHLNGWRVAGDGTPFRPQKMLWQNSVKQGGFNPPKPNDTTVPPEQTPSATDQDQLNK
jgi:hypothetical protein